MKQCIILLVVVFTCVNARSSNDLIWPRQDKCAGAWKWCWLPSWAESLPCEDGFECKGSKWGRACVPTTSYIRTAWKTCGGEDRRDIISCGEGLHCAYKNKWYSQCQPTHNCMIKSLEMLWNPVTSGDTCNGMMRSAQSQADKAISFNAWQYAENKGKVTCGKKDKSEKSSEKSDRKRRSPNHKANQNAQKILQCQCCEGSHCPTLRKGGNSRSRQVNAQCSAYGDPHYSTLDKKKYNFQGNCEYTLFARGMCGEEGRRNTTFEVQVRNTLPRGNSRRQVSMTEAVAIRLPQGKLEMYKKGNGNDHAIYYNGEDLMDYLSDDQKKNGAEKGNLELVLEDGVSLQLYKQSAIVHIDTAAFVGSVDWDGRHRVNVKVSDESEEDACGLCGDHDGDSSNDMEHVKEMGNKLSVSPYYTLFTAKDHARGEDVLDKFCSSEWNPNDGKEDESGSGNDGEEEEGPEDEDKPKITFPEVGDEDETEDPCGENTDLQNKAKIFCGALSNSEGSFRLCHESVDPAEFYTSCYHDFCLSDGDKETACDSMILYAEKCREAGLPMPGDDANCKINDFVIHDLPDIDDIVTIAPATKTQQQATTKAPTTAKATTQAPTTETATEPATTVKATTQPPTTKLDVPTTRSIAIDMITSTTDAPSDNGDGSLNDQDDVGGKHTTSAAVVTTTAAVNTPILEIIPTIGITELTEPRRALIAGADYNSVLQNSEDVVVLGVAVSAAIRTATDGMVVLPQLPSFSQGSVIAHLEVPASSDTLSAIDAVLAQCSVVVEFKNEKFLMGTTQACNQAKGQGSGSGNGNDNDNGSGNQGMDTSDVNLQAAQDGEGEDNSSSSSKTASIIIPIIIMAAIIVLVLALIVRSRRKDEERDLAEKRGSRVRYSSFTASSSGSSHASDAYYSEPSDPSNYDHCYGNVKQPGGEGIYDHTVHRKTTQRMPEEAGDIYDMGNNNGIIDVNDMYETAVTQNNEYYSSSGLELYDSATNNNDMPLYEAAAGNGGGDIPMYEAAVNKPVDIPLYEAADGNPSMGMPLYEAAAMDTAASMTFQDEYYDTAGDMNARFSGEYAQTGEPTYDLSSGTATLRRRSGSSTSSRAAPTLFEEPTYAEASGLADYDVAANSQGNLDQQQQQQQNLYQEASVSIDMDAEIDELYSIPDEVTAN
eukprot:m.248284 g.248284  ORF g.248284 m.248284 type:complete len:1162 (+) comp16132_c0_seq1:148-3633(+)